MGTAYKILLPKACQQQCLLWRRESAQVVFTNGCFDVLHLGHIVLLEQAKAQGNHLIVGVNTDSSVRRLKGKSRPVNTFSDRARMLAALSCVDVVVGFEEDTPQTLIEQLLPDVLVKGGDYTTDQVVGADIVEKIGGSVKIISLVLGYSSSACIEKIQKSGIKS